jgi:subtilisin family serine protease
MRLLTLLVWLGLVTTLAVAAGTVAQSGATQPTERGDVLDDPHEGRFVYLRSGAPITLQASPLYAAALVSDTTGRTGPLTPPDGLELDPRGNRPDLIERGVTLFRVPNSVTPRGLDSPPPSDAWQVTLGSGLPAQPVFEHGAALRMPSDEVIVAFHPETTLEDAQRLLSGAWDDLDARGLLELRPGNFICMLRDASAGRAFEVSRMLTQVEGVLWAEPSFINVHLETPGGPPGGRFLPGLPSSLTHQQKLESKFLSRSVSAIERDPEGDVWHVSIDGHFEGDVDKWIVARAEGSNRILPVVARDRTRDENRSVYMSGKGLAANALPDPYLEGAGSYLISPNFNLAAYRDVFVELWFWARFEDPVDAPRRVHDFGRVQLFDVEANETIYEQLIVPVGPSGDLTRRPGTDRGWRKLMFRVPVQKLARLLQVRVQFYSDGLHGADGLFVDDIRVLYSSGGGGAPFSRDPAARHQYAIMPRGQIAGRPASGDPRTDAAAAWSAGIPKQDVIVALLDDGVERGHPDLAFWEPGKDEDGQSEDDALADGVPRGEERLFPGEPVSLEDRHGTACAGVLGAIANNGIGIAGVAPGALLLPLHRGIDDLSIVRAIDAAVEHGAHVLVLPWGWTGAAPEVITRAIIDAIDAGTTIVAAAGDGVHRPYSDAVDYPCVLSASTPLICVGASSIAGEPKGPASADGLYWWSSAEDETGPDLLAPGTWLHATDRRGPLGYNDGSQNVPPDWTDEFAGTGASACYVGGVATLMASHDPLLQPEELKRLMISTATKLPPSSVQRNDLRLVEPKAAAQAAIESATARAREGDPSDAALDH